MGKILKYIAIFIAVTAIFIVSIINIKVATKDNINEYESLYVEFYKSRSQDTYTELLQTIDNKIEKRYLELFLNNSNGQLNISSKNSYDTLIMQKILDIENKQSVEHIEFQKILEDFDKIKNRVNLYYLMKKMIEQQSSILENWAFFSLYKKIGIYFHSQNFVDSAEDIFVALTNTKFTDVEVLCWYGSTLTKFALFKKSPIDKIEYVNRGVQKIELAYSKAPNNLSVRLIRIQNYASLPKFFKKSEIAYKDILKFIKDYQDKKRVEVVGNQAKIEMIDIPKKEICSLMNFVNNSEAFNNEQKVHIIKEIPNEVCKK